MASFPAQADKFSSNYVMFCHIRGVASLRITIKTHLTLATLAFGLAPCTVWYYIFSSSYILLPVYGRVGGTIVISTLPSSYN